MHALLVVAALLAFSPAALAAMTCSTQSGPTRTALLELYTSEGCSSCPPADQWLSDLSAQGITLQQVVTLAFHVDYWDRLGWVDPFAQPGFTQRQRERNGRLGWVYTPQFMLDGEDFRPAKRALEALSARAASTAALQLTLDRSDPRRWITQLRAALTKPGDAHHVYLALYENNLVSRILAGENAQRTLHHDFVVRQLQGPFVLDANGQFQRPLTLTLKPDWKPQDMGIAAFIQRADGAVVQALALPACR